MRLVLFILILFFYRKGDTQDYAINIIYENEDAFNLLKEYPSTAEYISKINGYEFLKGSALSSLKLYRDVGAYTVDSVFLESSGMMAKAWYFSKIDIRDYTNGNRFSIYPEAVAGIAYLQDNCKDDVIWKTDPVKQKTILGIQCKYAVRYSKMDTYHIWYTTEFPYKDGPFKANDENGCNLPGLVLEYSKGNDFTVSAIDIDFLPVNLDLRDKIDALKMLDKSKEPSYSPGQQIPNWMILLNEGSPIKQWIKLGYPEEFWEYWLAH